MKTCTRCETTKSVEEFSSQPSRKDGLSSWCKPCLRENTRKNRAKTGYVERENAVRRASVADRKRTDPGFTARLKWTKAISDAKRAAERHGAPYVAYTLEDLEAVYGPCTMWTCVYCGTSDGLSLDHVRPISTGGPDAAYNVVPACHRPAHGTGCNQRKSGLSLGAWLDSLAGTELGERTRGLHALLLAYSARG